MPPVTLGDTGISDRQGLRMKGMRSSESFGRWVGRIPTVFVGTEAFGARVRELDDVRGPTERRF